MVRDDIEWPDIFLNAVQCFTLKLRSFEIIFDVYSAYTVIWTEVRITDLTSSDVYNVVFRKLKVLKQALI